MQPIKPAPIIPMPQPPQPAAAPKFDTIASAVSEAISVPDRPAVEKPGVVTWAMPAPAVTATRSVSPYGTKEDYFGMVRFEIEKKKRYPPTAVKRQIEGRVRVRFILDANGRAHDVAIVEKSRHDILDQAALDAVNAASPFPMPPSQLFNGPVALDLVIAFELT